MVQVWSVICVLFLIIDAVMEVYLLVHKKMGGNLRGLLLVLLPVLFVGCVYILLFPHIKPLPTTGEFQVETVTCYYTDDERTDPFREDGKKRELPVQFWYPKEASQNQDCPFVVFSHGSNGTRENNLTLYRELASHGYVVCSIDHPYHAFSTRLENGEKITTHSEFIKEMMADDPKKNPEQSVEHFQKWMKLRTDDINYVMDTVLAKAKEDKKELDVYGMIDTEKICVMGHSLGGAAALGIGRMREDVDAVVALEAPFLCDITGVDEQGRFTFVEEEYPVAVMNIYSDSSWDNLKDWKQYEENVELLSKESANIKNVHLNGVGHLGLSDLAWTTPVLTAILDGGIMNKDMEGTFQEINQVCLDFLEEHLQ